MKSTLRFLVLLSAICSITSQANTVNWQQQINALAAEELKATGVPSLQIAVGLDDAIIFEQAFGLADIENKVPASSKTKYRIASISKWLTASAAMALVDAGELDLDLPIQQYCPEFPQKAWTVTTRHLMTHTSGIRHYANYDGELAKAKSQVQRDEIEKRRANSLLGRFTRYTDMHQPLDAFKNDKLLFKPGSDWKYSSFGYRVLGCVLEGAAKKPYADLMQQRVLTPANMQNTVNDDAWQIIAHRSSGYRLKDKNLRRANMRDISENLPAGGHLSTASDLVKFAQAFNAGRLVNNQHKMLMYKPLHKSLEQMYRAPIWSDAIPSKDSYGYGVMLFPEMTNLRIGHSGRQAGADAMLVLNPTSKLSIAILSNVKGYNGELKLIEKIEAIIAANFKDKN